MAHTSEQRPWWPFPFRATTWTKYTDAPRHKHSSSRMPVRNHSSCLPLGSHLGSPRSSPLPSLGVGVGQCGLQSTPSHVSTNDELVPTKRE
jgi:hypothetical protein